MDFRAPPPVIEALRRRLDHGVFGYEAVPDGLIPALIGRRAEPATVTAEPIRLRVPRESAGFDPMCRNVKLQRHFIGYGDKILGRFEGRDSAGKGGVIKRIVQHLRPRKTSVVALGQPPDRERGSWYFQRLKQWKVSPIDRVAPKRWGDYSEARNQMLARTHHPVAPWQVVRADEKREARVNLIRDLLSRLPYKGKKEQSLIPDPSVVFEFERAAMDDELLAP